MINIQPGISNTRKLLLKAIHNDVELHKKILTFNVSHDFNTPLSFSKTLRSQLLNPKLNGVDECN